MNIESQQVFPVLSVEYELKLPHNQRRHKAKTTPRKKLRKLPYVTRMLALAYHLQGLVDKGVVSDYADIARLSGLSRPRITQIMNLIMLAPTIQEEILSFPKSFMGGINERNLRKVLTTPVWREQTKIWEEIKSAKLHLEKTD